MTELLDIAEDWVRQVWQRGDMEYAGSLCAENYVDYSVPESPDGDCAAFQKAVMDLRAAFPDLQVRIEDSFQDQDFVILRVSFSGTHENEFEDFAPTGQMLEWESIDILHFRDDLLMEHFSQDDLLAALEYTATGPDEPEEDGEESLEPEASQSDFGELQLETERTQLIERLADGPRRVREAIRSSGARPAHLDAWSTAATVGHLWQVERQIWQAGLQQLADNRNPFWESWEPDFVDLESEFGATDLNVLLDAFDFLRAQTCRYLEELPNFEWSRRGTHQEDGELDVAGLMQKAIEHDQEHLASLTGAQL
jgi:predicted ester cyclase